MSEGHHILRQQTVKQAVSAAAVKVKIGKPISAGEQRLLDTPLTVVLNDPRNIVKLSRAAHHRAHHAERLRENQLPRGIYDFASDYGLEAALDRELALIRGGK